MARQQQIAPAAELLHMHAEVIEDADEELLEARLVIRRADLRIISAARSGWLELSSSSRSCPLCSFSALVRAEPPSRG
jgi:hypothetical protein